MTINSFIEIGAASLTLACVLLLMYKKVLGWPVAIVAAGLYMYTFYQAELIAQTVLQAVFMFQSFYGWGNWGNENEDELKVKPLNNKEIGNYIVFVCVFTGIFTFITQPEEIFLGAFDAFIMGIALLANFLLSKKVIQSWYLWGLVDLLSVFLFLAYELYWSVLLYAILMIIAMNTYITWNKDFKSISTRRKMSNDEQ